MVKAYGLENGKPKWNEPFGYPAQMGCDYFKFGIYGDLNAPVWMAFIDRFRRGSARQDAEPPPRLLAIAALLPCSTALYFNDRISSRHVTIARR